MEQTASAVARLALLSILGVFSALPIPGSAFGQGAPPTGSPEELLVRFHAGVSRANAKNAVRAEGAEPVDEISVLRIHRIRAAQGHGANVTNRLRRRPDVEFVEQDAAHAPADVPNDPEYANQWHLPMIGAPAAWDSTHGSTSVVIAVLDSGVDATHPDLASKLVPGWNFYGNNSDTADVYGHGTKVAGAAAAATHNGVGVAGVGWATKVMPIRVTDTSGSGYTSAMANGITWAVDHGARVMNLSFETMASSTTVRNAAQYAMSRGALVVVAAGNCGCADATAENPYVLSVGSTNSGDALSGFSARGAFVDLSAPGESIETTARGGGYAYVSGTSFASPVVAGVAALMMAKNPSASPDEIVAWLEETALDLGAAGHDTSFGAGRVEADLSVAAAGAGSGSPPPDTTAPSATITSPSVNSIVAGTVNVAVTAVDDRALAKIELWVDGQMIASDPTAPYSFAWSSTSVSNAAHVLAAVAEDTSGNRGSSAGIWLTVANPVDLSPPLAFIDAPFLGATVTRTITIKSHAMDDLDLASLKVKVDGQVLGSASCTGTTCALNLSWNTKKAGRGVHTISAEATDRAGKVATSAPVAVTVR